MTTPILPDNLIEEMKRLGSRNYPVIGVPMYLLPEDLTVEAVPKGDAAPASPESAALGVAFREAARRIEAQKGSIDAKDIAGIIELLADRTFIDRPFSELSSED